MENLDQLVNKVQNAYENWNNNIYKKSISRFPERQKVFTTQSFTPVKPLYYSKIYKMKIIMRISVIPVFILSHAEFSQQCTAEDYGL